MSYLKFLETAIVEIFLKNNNQDLTFDDLLKKLRVSHDDLRFILDKLKKENVIHEYIPFDFPKHPVTYSLSIEYRLKQRYKWDDQKWSQFNR